LRPLRMFSIACLRLCAVMPLLPGEQIGHRLRRPTVLELPCTARGCCSVLMALACLIGGAHGAERAPPILFHAKSAEIRTRGFRSQPGEAPSTITG
jgi:hypothetical protein